MAASENIKIQEPIKKGVADVPVIMQLEALECGAASLAMVLAYYEKWVALEQVRVDCGVSRNGSNAKNIMRAARIYGLKAKGLFFEPGALRNKATFPCIIHWNLKHFVVLKGFKGKYAYINDPAKGEIRVTMEELDSSFTGVCLMFEPTESFEPSGKKKSVYDFAKKRMVGTAPAIAFTILTGIIALQIGIIRPLTDRLFIDRIISGLDRQWLMPYMTFMLLLLVIELLYEGIKSFYSYRLSGKMSVIGSASFFWKVLHLPQEFFTQRMAGDVLQRQASNAGVAEGIVNTFAPLFLNSAVLVFYLVIMLKHSVFLTLFGVFAMFLQLLVARQISRRRVDISRVMVRDGGKLEATTVAGIENIESIKASGAENGYFARWAGYQASVNAGRAKFIRVDEGLGMVPEILSVMTNYIIYFVGIYYVIKGNFTIGLVYAFQGYMGSFMSPARTIISADQAIQEIRTGMERIDDVMDYPEDPMAVEKPMDPGKNYTKLSGKLEMKNVTFGYSRLDEPLIKNFNLKVEPGQKIALVGGSGCGKSTISKLISGLYLPWDGEISFDDTPIKDIDRRVFTGTLAVVDQDVTLFEDTITNNIRMWDNSIEDFEVIMAARDARLHEDIMKCEGGYSYKLNEGGSNLSGGQRQRVEIARVLAQDPSIIILDEATSALDAKTEAEVMQAVRARGVTCIVIAHRLSTIRDCDDIIVLDHGKIVEEGNHEQLMALKGEYYGLVSSD